MMAYDAQVMEQMSEEEILACLVAETEPKFTVRLTVAWITSSIQDFSLLLEHYSTDPNICKDTKGLLL